jgi:hypothetical protein
MLPDGPHLSVWFPIALLKFVLSQYGNLKHIDDMAAMWLR